jgi:hypothetical protein
VVAYQNGLDDSPGGLDGVLSGKQRAVAGHGVCEQPLVGRLFVGFGVKQEQLALVTDELLARTLDPGGERDRGIRREPEPQVVGRSCSRPGVSEQLLRGRLELPRVAVRPPSATICFTLSLRSPFAFAFAEPLSPTIWRISGAPPASTETSSILLH